MFLEFGFHAHQTRLNIGFLLSVYVGRQGSWTKNEMFGTIGGVALIKLVLLSCLFCCIQSASKVASAKVGMKNDRFIPLKCP